jgi:6-pyruvoyltetrahydropterin/6-carboxytetrahydropterin synthase
VTTTVTVRHNFETAHRLPHLGGKCANLHGHSWWADVTIEGPPRVDGIVVDFGTLKRELRQWIDHYLDHGTALGGNDPLVPALVEQRCKLFLFGESPGTGDLLWPTVENMAELLRRVTESLLDHLNGTVEFPLRVARVKVTETATNAAEVTP